MGAVFRAVFGYCFLVFMVRIVGRRPGEQITPFDFVLIFFMGGLTLTPMVGDDRSIVNALCIITTLAVTHFAIAWLKHKFAWFGLKSPSDRTSNFKSAGGGSSVLSGWC